MTRRRSEALTEREAQIMNVVWRETEATAEQVRAALPDAPHDSTVRTLLRVLETKGYLTHEVRGKVYVYRAAVAQRKAQQNALRSVLARFFSGSAEDLVLRLIEDERLTPDQIAALSESAARPRIKTRRYKGGDPR
jgi:predicted transcriptional regulator